jgi:hypothetical protein
MLKYFSILCPPISETALFLEGSQGSSVCPSSNSNMQMKMNTEYWWNDTDWGRHKQSKSNPSQINFVNHRSYKHKGLGMNPEQCVWKAGD